MTNYEFKNLINNSAHPDWLNSYQTTITFESINEKQNFTGFYPLYVYLNQQIDGFIDFGKNVPDEFTQSINYFKLYKDVLENVIKYAQKAPDGLNGPNGPNPPNDQIVRNWQNMLTGIPKMTYQLFPYDCDEISFLQSVYLNNNLQYKGALRYIIGAVDNQNFTKEMLTGYLLAYEFSMQGDSNIFNRRIHGRASMSKLKSDFKNYISESEQHLRELREDHLNKSKEQIDKLNAQAQEQNMSFSHWFNTLEIDTWPNWFSAAETNMSNIAKVYSADLKLKEPAKYWSDRAQLMNAQGWKAFKTLLALVIVSCISLGILLWISPDQIYLSWFKDDKSAAIRWTLVYITLLSLIAFGIKVVTKFMMSSFHIARDNEERHTLAYFYLALLKDTTVSDNDRQLIMQSLFSRADTGLLKDESAPTMPNDILSRIPKMPGNS